MNQLQDAGMSHKQGTEETMCNFIEKNNVLHVHAMYASFATKYHPAIAIIH